MKNILFWIFSLIYFALYIFFFKNFDFLPNIYERICILIKNISISKIMFVSITFVFPEGLIFYVINR